MEVVNDMIDENTLNATIIRFRKEYPVAVLDRQAMRALLEAYEQVRIAVLKPERKEGIIVQAIALDFDRPFPRVTFEVPKDSRWGFGLYRIVRDSNLPVLQTRD